MPQRGGLHNNPQFQQKLIVIYTSMQMGYALYEAFVTKADRDDGHNGVNPRINGTYSSCLPSRYCSGLFHCGPTGYNINPARVQPLLLEICAGPKIRESAPSCPLACPSAIMATFDKIYEVVVVGGGNAVFSAATGAAQVALACSLLRKHLDPTPVEIPSSLPARTALVSAAWTTCCP